MGTGSHESSQCRNLTHFKAECIRVSSGLCTPHFRNAPSSTIHAIAMKTFHLFATSTEPRVSVRFLRKARYFSLGSLLPQGLIEPQMRPSNAPCVDLEVRLALMIGHASPLPTPRKCFWPNSKTSQQPHSPEAPVNICFKGPLIQGQGCKSRDQASKLLHEALRRHHSADFVLQTKFQHGRRTWRRSLDR